MPEPKTGPVPPVWTAHSGDTIVLMLFFAPTGGGGENGGSGKAGGDAGDGGKAGGGGKAVGSESGGQQ